MNDVAAIILAAGMGKRMKSPKAKVLHEILGKPMVLYVLQTAITIAGNNVILVIGNQSETVRKVVSAHHQVRYALQEKQLGTGHAVSCALPELPEAIQQVIILCGDVPLISKHTITYLLNDHIFLNRDLTLLAVEMDNPKGYGRVLMNENREVSGIVEEADADDEQKKIRTVNAGIYCAKKGFLKDFLIEIDKNNAQGELYFTDIVGIGYKNGKRIGAIVSQNVDEVIGVNTYEDLKKAESILKGLI